MYHRPNDHLDYLQQCIEKIRANGMDSVRWDLFLQSKPVEKLSLHTKTKVDEDSSQHDAIPKIDSPRLCVKEDTVVICIISGPGIDRSIISEELIMHYPKFIYVNLPDLLKTRAINEQTQQQSRWHDAIQKLNNGELLPNDIVLETLLLKLNQHSDADGFIIYGFPKTEIQYLDLKQYVGMDRLKCAILLDISEEYSRKRLSERISHTDEVCNNNEPDSIDRCLSIFKNQTLQACKLIDDDEKLRVIDGELNCNEILEDILEVCDHMISNNLVDSEVHHTSNASPDNLLIPINHGTRGRGSRPSISSIPRIVPVFSDNGRMSGIYNCPIILLLGGPGSGRTEQALSLCEKFSGLAYFNVTDFLRKNVLDFINENDTKDWDVIARRVHSSDPPLKKDRLIPEYWDVQSEVIRLESSNLAGNSRAVIIEGFPCHEGQLNTFNQCIGGVDLVILLDCEETTLIDRLHQRYERLKRAEDEDAVVLQRISFFKHCTLPVIRYYDERGKLVTIPGDQEQSLIFKHLVAVIEFFLRMKEEPKNETSDNEIVNTEEIIPVISKLLKNENRKLLTGVTIDDDQSLETSFEDSVTKDNDSSPSSQLIITPEGNQNSLDQIESKLDNLEGSPEKTVNDDLDKYKFIFVIGSCDEIRRLYCKHILKQCNYNYISMKSITDPVNLDGDNTFSLEKLIQIITEEMSRTRKAGYIIDGIPNSLAQAKEIEAYNDSLKFSNCKLIILLEDKFSDHDHSGDNSQCHKNEIEESLIEFLESTKKICRISCSKSEDEIAYQLHNLFS
uniref:Adenylate kinase isoenzyme 5 homolog n=1 Tax=Schistosoma mansoni TaxID=6183 RepID=A0A5K4F5F9_SCHMA